MTRLCKAPLVLGLALVGLALPGMSLRATRAQTPPGQSGLLPGQPGTPGRPASSGQTVPDGRTGDATQPGLRPSTSPAPTRAQLKLNAEAEAARKLTDDRLARRDAAARRSLQGICKGC